MGPDPFRTDDGVTAPASAERAHAVASEDEAATDAESGDEQRSRPWGLTLLAAAVAAVIVVPVAWIGVMALTVDLERALSIVFRPMTLEVLTNTLVLIALVTTFSVLIGVPLAILTVLTDLPCRRFWLAALALPLVIPSYTSAYAFISIWGPHGLAQSLVEPLGIASLPELYGMPGTVAILTLYNYPFVFITTVAALRAFDKTYIDAARTLEDNLFGVFREVVLPMTKPAIAAGALLAALETAGDFGVPAMLRLNVFTRQIYVEHNALSHDYAAMLSLHLVAITLVILVLEYAVREHRTIHGGSRGGSRSYTFHLGAWKWPALAVCAAIVGLAVILPVSVLLWWLVRGPETYVGAFGFRLEYALNSVSVSLLAALAAVVLALPVAYLSARYRSLASTVLERATYVGFAVPGVVIGLSLVYFGSAYAPTLYQTIPLLVFAYVVLYLPLAVGAARTAFLYVNPRFVEAARSLGCPPRTAFRRVTLPLVVPGLVAGGALVFLHGMKELPATLLLRPAGFDSLATFIWMAERNAYYGYAAVPALVLVCVSALAIVGVLPGNGTELWRRVRRRIGTKRMNSPNQNDETTDRDDTDPFNQSGGPPTRTRSATDGGNPVQDDTPNRSRSDNEESNRSLSDSDASPVLELECVTKSYGARPAVSDLSLSVQEGELLTLLGPSGCGKTTTLRLIAGLVRPDSGTIRIRNDSVADAADETFVPSEERDVGIVFQDFALFPHKTVAENVAFGLGDRDGAGENGRPADEIVDDLLELVGLSDYGDRFPDELSGGQKQRIALARSLAPEPDVLLLDEPLSNLDAGLRVQMRETVSEILDRVDVTAVWVTHDQTEALSVGDRTAVMIDGEIAQADSPRALFMRPESRAVADFLGQASYLPGRQNATGVVETPIGTLDGDRVAVQSSAKRGGSTDQEQAQERNDSGNSSDTDAGADADADATSNNEDNSSTTHNLNLDLLLRPDDISITNSASDTADGRIVHRQFTGSTVRYRVVLDSTPGLATAQSVDQRGEDIADGAPVLECRCSHETWYEVGTPVSVSITASHSVPAFPQ
ncbi:ABC-type transport system ATP-binding/permease protein (probable substrate iron) [Natrialba magadii ATCC 43099]|uniref:Molybdate/tungstate import ATP-binding protein WtpC n=1 Tax=Natrialba magadii (strain ATCC 43099 / DSM 3394 / CCM 3739 / CIP 104546 / IAM 13178 / JCM 8861 / NBRC 102185 / NCIMB 2190 / MS3) TaxID=547559 RepID=D3STM4_NATMM|nr:ATP-binding cassette domain-containing protein [Natrialba magadii]ADD05041.1 ABC-type transport system ATP-binding/permease protein (probable substrate iron) [Natrialba magadii ATCC 43099]ELY23415.1 ABC transporter [Natrialba magadii ATCC 43099]